MKKNFFLSAILFSAKLLTAQEYWIQPDKFLYKRGEPINIHSGVEDSLLQKSWIKSNDTLQNLHFHFGGVTDKDLLKTWANKKGDSLQLSLHDEGTAMITFYTTNKFLETQPDSFNQYLAENGFTEAIVFREQNNKTNVTGREYLQKSVKIIFQVGTKTDKTYKQPTNLPIDFIPEDHPYNAANEEKFKIKILFRGNPVANQKVKVSHRLNDKMTEIEYKTDADGNFKFFFTPEGYWRISTIKMIRLNNDPKAEWQSYWGSLIWGYDQ